jgi:Icc-related predicted phosphoesterase
MPQNDYVRIRLENPHRRLRPADTMAIHRADRQWLETRLRADPHVPTVVLTHHAPSPLSLLPGTEACASSACYASNCHDLIAEGNIVLWVHGHIHRAVDYRIGHTRILSNPRGRPEERETSRFRDDLVITL